MTFFGLLASLVPAPAPNLSRSAPDPQNHRFSDQQSSFFSLSSQVFHGVPPDAVTTTLGNALPPGTLQKLTLFALWFPIPSVPPNAVITTWRNVPPGALTPIWGNVPPDATMPAWGNVPPDAGVHTWGNALCRYYGVRRWHAAGVFD